MRLGALGGELLLDVGETGRRRLRRTRREPAAPAVLPARFPNLLVNGSFSVATGRASLIPPHNLREVVDAALAYSDDPKIDTAGPMRHVLGRTSRPAAWSAAARSCMTPTSQAAARSPCAGARARAGPQPARAIVVTELPFMVSTGGRGGLLAEIRRATRGKEGARHPRRRGRVQRGRRAADRRGAQRAPTPISCSTSSTGTRSCRPPTSWSSSRTWTAGPPITCATRSRLRRAPSRGRRAP